jgi:hypothetical protein
MFARDFQTLTSGLTIAFGVLSALIATGGVITLATAGFRALGLALAAARLASFGTTLIGVLTPLGWVAGAIAAVAAAGVGVYELYQHRAGIEDWFKRVFNVGDGARTGASGSWANASGSGYTVLPGTRHTIVRTQVHLDGRQIANVVTKHQTSAANAPQTGLSGFDGTMAPIPAGATGVW